MRYLLPLLLFVIGCAPTYSDYATRPGNPWGIVKTYHVDITVGKYDKFSCIDKGGTWVSGDSKEFLNALVGCIEPTSETK